MPINFVTATCTIFALISIVTKLLKQQNCSENILPQEFQNAINKLPLTTVYIRLCVERKGPLLSNNVVSNITYVWQ